MLTPGCRPLELTVILWPESGDFAEVTLEINGRLMASAVYGPDWSYEACAAANARLIRDAMARC